MSLDALSNQIRLIQKAHPYNSIEIIAADYWMNATGILEKKTVATRIADWFFRRKHVDQLASFLDSVDTEINDWKNRTAKIDLNQAPAIQLICTVSQHILTKWQAKAENCIASEQWIQKQREKQELTGWRKKWLLQLKINAFIAMRKFFEPSRHTVQKQMTQAKKIRQKIVQWNISALLSNAFSENQIQQFVPYFLFTNVKRGFKNVVHFNNLTDCFLFRSCLQSEEIANALVKNGIFRFPAIKDFPLLTENNLPSLLHVMELLVKYDNCQGLHQGFTYLAKILSLEQIRLTSEKIESSHIILEKYTSFFFAQDRQREEQFANIIQLLKAFTIEDYQKGMKSCFTWLTGQQKQLIAFVQSSTKKEKSNNEIFYLNLIKFFHRLKNQEGVLACIQGFPLKSGTANATQLIQLLDTKTAPSFEKIKNIVFHDLTDMFSLFQTCFTSGKIPDTFLQNGSLCFSQSFFTSQRNSWPPKEEHISFLVDLLNIFSKHQNKQAIQDCLTCFVDSFQLRYWQSDFWSFTNQKKALESIQQLPSSLSSKTLDLLLVVSVHLLKALTANAQMHRKMEEYLYFLSKAFEANPKFSLEIRTSSLWVNLLELLQEKKCFFFKESSFVFLLNFIERSHEYYQENNNNVINARAVLLKYIQKYLEQPNLRLSRQAQNCLLSFLLSDNTKTFADSRCCLTLANIFLNENNSKGVETCLQSLVQRDSLYSDHSQQLAQLIKSLNFIDSVPLDLLWTFLEKSIPTFRHAKDRESVDFCFQQLSKLCQEERITAIPLLSQAPLRISPNFRRSRPCLTDEELRFVFLMLQLFQKQNQPSDVQNIHEFLLDRVKGPVYLRDEALEQQLVTILRKDIFKTDDIPLSIGETLYFPKKPDYYWEPLDDYWHMPRAACFIDFSLTEKEEEQLSQLLVFVSVFYPDASESRIIVMPGPFKLKILLSKKPPEDLLNLLDLYNAVPKQYIRCLIVDVLKSKALSREFPALLLEKMLLALTKKNSDILLHDLKNIIAIQYNRVSDSFRKEIFERFSKKSTRQEEVNELSLTMDKLSLKSDGLSNSNQDQLFQNSLLPQLKQEEIPIHFANFPECTYESVKYAAQTTDLPLWGLEKFLVPSSEKEDTTSTTITLGTQKFLKALLERTEAFKTNGFKLYDSKNTSYAFVRVLEPYLEIENVEDTEEGKISDEEIIKSPVIAQAISDFFTFLATRKCPECTSATLNTNVLLFLLLIKSFCSPKTKKQCYKAIGEQLYLLIKSVPSKQEWRKLEQEVIIFLNWLEQEPEIKEATTETEKISRHLRQLKEALQFDLESKQFFLKRRLEF